MTNDGPHRPPQHESAVIGLGSGSHPIAGPEREFRGGLHLTRKEGEGLKIGKNIFVQFVRFGRGRRVELRVVAPLSLNVSRVGPEDIPAGSSPDGVDRKECTR